MRAPVRKDVINTANVQRDQDRDRERGTDRKTERRSGTHRERDSQGKRDLILQNFIYTNLHRCTSALFR